MEKITQCIINEVVGKLIRLTIILGILCIAIYAFYVSIVCGKASSIPFIYKLCPGHETNLPSHLPLENLTENTVSLAKILSSVDATTPIHCVEAKIALVEIRAEIIHSDITPRIKNNLAELIQNLQDLMDKGAEESTSMLTSFDSSLDSIKIYTEVLLDDLSKSKNSNNYQSQQLLIESSNMKTTDLATDVFNDYTDKINRQIDKALLTAQNFQMTLNLIAGKISMIQELIQKGKHIDNVQLDKLLDDSIRTRLFGKDIVKIRKHQRNIKKLTEFNNFIRVLSKQLATIIINLKKYKSNATNLKETVAELHVLQSKTPERQLAMIKASINRLIQVKEAFEKKLKGDTQEKYIT